MNKLMVAVVAGAMALGAQAETFLEKLAADVRKVDSSPYATGGDYILNTGTRMVHVFTSTSAATFTPTKDITATILLVGGGGGGGGDGWWSGPAGNVGGSGGGACKSSGSPGAGTAGQGNAGGVVIIGSELTDRVALIE